MEASLTQEPETLKQRSWRSREVSLLFSSFFFQYQVFKEHKDVHSKILRWGASETLEDCMFA